MRIQRGQSLTAVDLLVLMQARTSWMSRVTRKLADVDALIMPTVPIVPPAIEPLIQDDQLYGKTNMLVLRNCSVINFLDGCALSLPCHAKGEAPVGFMLASVGGNDQRLQSMGLAIEQVLRQATQA